jgi:hypothetical protein
MAARIRYRGRVYQVEGGNWRGPDGHVVHLLTWITDDLSRLPETRPGGPDPDADAARRVVERLGADAEVVG